MQKKFVRLWRNRLSKKEMRFLFLTISILLLATASFAQNFRFRNITMQEGLPANGVRSIVQDGSGFVWLGTDNGLCRYDGRQVKTFEFSDDPLNQYVSWLAISGDHLLIGSDLGLYDLNLITYQVTKPHLPAVEEGRQPGILNISVNGGKAWLSTDRQGVFCHDQHSGKTTRYTLGTDLTTTFVLCDSHGNVWASKKNTEPLIYYKGVEDAGFSPVKLRNIKNTSYARAMYEDSYGRLWYGTWEDGLYLIDSTATAQKAPIADNCLSHIHNIYEYRPGLLMIGSDDGLCCYDTERRTYTMLTPDNTDPTSLSSRFVYSIIADTWGTLWVGTFYGGANFAANGTLYFENLTHNQYKNSISGNVISEIKEDQRHNIWIASDDGGLTRYDPEKGTFENYMQDLNIHALCCNGPEVWAGTYSQGIRRLDTKTQKIKQYTTKDGNFLGQSCYAMHIKGDTLYAASWDSLYFYDKGNDVFTAVAPLKTIANNIEESPDGFLWIPTGEGLCRYDTQKHSHTTFKSQPKLSDINCIRITDSATILLGTKYGLHKFDTETKKFEKINALLPEVNSIETHGGITYIGTQKALAVYDGAHLNYFDTNDGLCGSQFTANASLHASDGKIYMGTTNGVVSFSPDEVRINSVAPKVLITKIHIIGKPYNGDTVSHLCKKIDVGADSSCIDLDFSVPGSPNQQPEKYLFKVEGIDGDWLELKKNTVSLNYLPEGEFVFKIKSVLKSGAESPETHLIINVIGNSMPIGAIIGLIIAAAAAIIALATKKKKQPAGTDIQTAGTESPTPPHGETATTTVQNTAAEPTQNTNAAPAQNIATAPVADENKTPGPDEKFMQDLRKAILDNITNTELDAATLSEIIGCSRSSLYQKVKALTGKTPNELIRNERLEKAAALLAQNRYRVNEVATMVGFNNLSYFAKVFYAQYGKKPSEMLK